MTPKQRKALAAKRIPGECSHKFVRATLGMDRCKNCGMDQLAFGLPDVVIKPRTEKSKSDRKQPGSAVPFLMIRSLHGDTMLDRPK